MSEASIRVLDLRSPVEAARLPSSNARLTWRHPLEPRDLDTIASWARTRGGASIRLYGAAVAQIDSVLDAIPVVALELDAARITRLPRSAAGVRELRLHGIPSAGRSVLEAFGDVRTLRVDARGETVDLQLLAALPQLRGLSLASASLRGCGGAGVPSALESLELVRTRVDAIDPLLRHPAMVALRLANVDRLASLDALQQHAGLRSLALESVLHLESLRPIGTLPRLETLAIARLWQFNVDDAAFVREMPSLRALSIDIGGRRKNVEIAKRLNLPEAPPFDVAGYDFTTSYASGVHNLPAYLSSVTTVGSAAGLASEKGGV
jgi:hypothetical protein